MKNIKKSLCLMLSLLMVFASLNIFSITAEASTYNTEQQMIRLACYCYGKLHGEKYGTTPSDDWKEIYSYDNPKTGFNCMFFKSTYEKESKHDYCIAYTGTTDLTDLKTYPSIALAIQNLQLDDAVEQFNFLIDQYKDDINKVYITGHSLGAYLASYVESEIVDDNVTSIDKDKTACYAFGDPGFSNRGINNWARMKINNNKNGKYDNYIYEYKNDFDPVANINQLASVWKVNITFTQIGTVTNLDHHAIIAIPMSKCKSKFLAVLIIAINMLSHMPNVYVEGLA